MYGLAKLRAVAKLQQTSIQSLKAKSGAINKITDSDPVTAVYSFCYLNKLYIYMQEQWRMEYLLYVKFFNHLDRVDISNSVWPKQSDGLKKTGNFVVLFQPRSQGFLL